MRSPNAQIQAPQSKHDFDSVANLDSLPVSSWQHLIPELLTWLQDVNWPIFAETERLLLKNPRALVDPLREVYRGDDDAWQYYCLHLIQQMPQDCKQMLKPDLLCFRARMTDEVDRDWDMTRDLDDAVS